MKRRWGSAAVLGRKTRRRFGRPTRPAEPPGGGPAGRNRPAETAAEDFGRKFGRHRRPGRFRRFGRPAGQPNRREVVRPAEVGRPNRRPPFVRTAFYVYRLACGPLNNMTPAVATGRLLCAPPCVGTAFCVYRLACGPLNNMTPAVATGRLLCAPPCVGTAFCVYRLACGPLNNMTPAVATGRLLCAPPCVGTAFCVYRLACGP